MFGKRDRERLAGVPATMEAPPALPLSADAGEDGRVTAGWLAGLLAILVVGIFVLDAIVANTALITPIDRTYLWSMRCIGAIAGLPAGVLLSRFGNRRPFSKPMLILIAPLIGGMLFNGLAWRMADWWAFGLSRAAWESATYPVVGVRSNRKAPSGSILIDPYRTGEETGIAVPQAQYAMVREDPRAYCVTVKQRRSREGAVEILTRRAITWSAEPADLRRCAPAGPGGPGVSPWS